MSQLFAKKFVQFTRRNVQYQRRSVFIEASLVLKITGLLAASAATTGAIFAYNHYSYYAPENYEAVKTVVRKHLVQPDYVDGNIGPLIVRLVFNSCSTFDNSDGTGGIQGATMRFEKEHKMKFNKGLEIACQYLEPIKEQFPWISYADLYVLASYVALEEMGGPHIQFRGGRIDQKEADFFPIKERLFKIDWGPTGMRKVFHRMGCNDREISVLMHGHSMGRAHKEYTGYEGTWTSKPLEFGNEYSKELKYNDWALYREYGTKQFIDITQSLMMLSCDYCQNIDATFRYWLDVYIEDEEKLIRDFGITWKKVTEQGCFPMNTIRGLPQHDDEASSAETIEWLVELEQEELRIAEEAEERREEKYAEMELKYGKEIAEQMQDAEEAKEIQDTENENLPPQTEPLTRAYYQKDEGSVRVF